MKNKILVGTCLAMLGLAGCGKNTDPATSRQPAGRRVLLTPSSNEAVQGYLGSGAASPDLSLWVAASYGAQGSNSLLARLDTLGQPMSGRSLAFQAPATTRLLALDALPDGGAVVLGANNVGQPLLARLAADGSTTWSKQVAATPPGNFSLFARSMVAVGADALLCSMIGGSEFAFSRVKADGTAQAYNSYQLPAHYAVSQPFDFKALPNGQGALFAYQTAATTFLLAKLTVDGQLQWLRQLNLADLPPMPLTSGCTWRWPLPVATWQWP